MSDLIIQANSISKRYQLGTIGSNSLRRDIHGWWQKRFYKSNTLLFQWSNSYGRTNYGL